MILQINDVIKRFGNHLALDHLFLDAKNGGIMGLLGTKGAKKSKFAQIADLITLDVLK